MRRERCRCNRRHEDTTKEKKIDKNRFSEAVLMGREGKKGERERQRKGTGEGGQRRKVARY